jgi:hypothetical protein
MKRNLAPPPAESPPSDRAFYLKDHRGAVTGPFSAAALRQMAAERRLDLSWHVSADKVNWCTAAKVKGLSADLEAALAASLPAGERYRNLAPQEALALFLDKFILSNENFKDSFLFLQPLRLWWAKLTLPKDFVITEVTAAGVRHVRYNVGTGETREVDEKEVERNVSKGVRRVNWFLPLATVLGAAWAYWTVKDFVSNFSLTWGMLKTLAFMAFALVGFILKTKRSKVFVGYTLDPAARQRLDEIGEALSVLRRCSQVWMYWLQPGERKQHWKYNAGDTFRVARLPVAVFRRTIPNVETNLRVNGITYHSQAVYFLPEKVLVIEGGVVKGVPYSDLTTLIDSLEYVESEGHVYLDSEVIDHRWKFINRDGSRDRRFKNNVELPVVRCGILGLVVGGIQLRMMTTDSEAPAIFQRKLGRLKAALGQPAGPPVEIKRQAWPRSP